MMSVGTRLTRLVQTSVMVAALTMIATGSPARAASCLGLSKVNCEGASRCLWMERYKSEAGILVRAHCVDKNKKKGTILNQLFNNKTSSTTVTKLSTRKRVDVNSKPASKLK
ncbi:hypothetical protein [Cohaesibacter haloalkalitolerans]|uniref:hypothetical protein n=1 Tax=Cohaesibacter haloalkalitolerans TaxID=1162980 RepID=UPI000E649976|nr:hypothetical protein [Cohaesibacter haloalkalitolerans]